MPKIDPFFKKGSQASIDKWVAELNKQIQPFTKEGMVERLQQAMDLIGKAADKYVPHDTGRTRRSWFTKIETTSDGIVGLFGYDEAGVLTYVPLIYLNPDGKITFRTGNNPLAQDHWLDEGYLEVKDEVIALLSK